MRTFLHSIVLTLSISSAFAQRDLKDIPDPSPALQQESFQLAEGFEINLFASDPMIAKPVQINWDAQGRLWLVSSKIYPHLKPGQEADDEILVLEDTDGDGTADKKTVFADGLLIPTGVFPADGGAYVANSTEILFLKDTDGDGRADERKVILSGFGTEDTHHIIHTFRGGPDGMMYFNQSIYIHSHVETPWGVRRLMGGGIWHFRPESRELEVFCEGFVNTWGHQFNRWGQSFATDGAFGEGINYVFPGSVFCTAPGAKRIMAGLNPGQPKHCGLAVISGHHFPEPWQGRFITNDFRGHRLNSFTLTENGSGYASVQQEDLVKTTHKAFRPIGVEMGPDGALYIADWYNPIIQHGEVDFRDERRDQRHGRIWRVTAKGRPVIERPHFVKAASVDLLEMLRRPEEWTRFHAKRELRQRGAKEIVPLVDRWIAELPKDDPQYAELQVETLWVYQGLNVLPESLLRQVLKSSNHRAKAAAVRMLYHWHGRVSDSLALLKQAVNDAHPQVRLEAVNALRQVGTAEAFRLAMESMKFPLDTNADFALWTTAREMEAQWLPAFQSGNFTFGSAKQRQFALRAIDNPAALAPLFEALAEGSLSPDEVQQTLSLASELGSSEDLARLVPVAMKESAMQVSALQALCQAGRTRKMIPSGDISNIQSLFDAPDPSLRALAYEAAGLWKITTGREALEKVLSTSDSAMSDVTGALEGLRLLGAKDVLVEYASGSSPTERRMLAAAKLAQLDVNAAAPLAVSLLASAEEGAAVGELFAAFLGNTKGPNALAKALAEKKLPRAVAYAGLQRANASGNAAKPLIDALSRAGDLAPIAQDLSPEAMQTMMEEVHTQGDAKRGEAIYRREALQCAVCHALGGAGGSLGPDMISLGASAPVDYIIESLLAPSKKIKEGYHMTVVTTKDGTVHSGFVARENDRQLIMRDASNKEAIVHKSEIASKQIAPVSLMPAGLTSSLRRDEFTHLVRFLSELGKEGDYKVSPKRYVRRWRVFEFNDDVKEPVRQGDQRFFAQPDKLKQWLPAYSKINGALPIADIPSSKRWMIRVAPVQFEIDITTGGDVLFQFNSSQGYRIWAGTEEISPDKDKVTIPNLPRGRHVITLVVHPDKFGQDALQVELQSSPTNAAAAQLVSGM